MLEQLYIVTKNLDPSNLESDVSCQLPKPERLLHGRMYSASTVKAATVDCSLLDQLTANPCMTNTCPVMERHKSTLPV
jgi:hypothetical protein